MFAKIFPPGRRGNRLLLATGGVCLVAIAVGWTVWFSWYSESDPRYMRSDCIVRLKIEHPPHSDIRAAESLLFDVMSDNAYANKLPVEGFSYGNPDRSSVYVVYRDRCDEKFKLTEQIAQSYMRQHPQGVRIFVTSDVVQPSLDTVSFDGDLWIDGTPLRRHKLGMD